jgi:thiamine biosynthesis lipoprotein
MWDTRLVMGMPIKVGIVNPQASATSLNLVFDYFDEIDRRFSPYKPDSEVSRINDGPPEAEWSSQMQEVMRLSEQTKRQTNGYFDVYHAGRFDPSGLVKGWAINNAAQLLRSHGLAHFYIDAGGDIQVNGRDEHNELWSLGIRNPFNRDEIVKVIQTDRAGVATSGTAIRGQHIYNPLDAKPLTEIASLTVIGPDIYEADRFATAAFAMGRQGIMFIEQLNGFEAYMIDTNKQATMTSGFEEYVRA